MDSIRFLASRAPHERPPSAWFPVFKLTAGFLFLNALLCLEIPYGKMEWSALLRVSSDGLCLLAGMCLLVRSGRSFQPLAYAAVMVSVILLNLFQWADRLVPMVFNRAFNLFMDSQRLPDLVILLWRTRPPEAVLLGILGAGAGIAAMGWSVWRALKGLHDGLTSRSPAHRHLRLAVAVLSGMIWMVAAGAPTGFIKASIFPRLTEELQFILNLGEIRNHHQALFGEAMERAHRARGDLLDLNRASVFLIVVESYGMSAFNDPRHAAKVLPAARKTEAELRSIGFDMCSAYLTAPTFGGGSWLSHATLASGVHIDSQIAHDLLLVSALAPMSDYFNRAGYRTVRAMPGTQWPWPEGAFYRYEQTLIASDFDYRGPTFGFALMPDQFVLDWVARRIIQDTARPLFVEVILTGSHAAFDIQAPYLDDWDLIGDGSVFHTIPPLRFPFGWIRLPEASPAYSAAIAHVITLLKDFIRRHIDPNGLIIIVGDHQPCVELMDSEQPWSVPVHVISGNPDFIRNFTRRGYKPGLVPMRPLPHPGMETLFWDLIEGFSRGHPDGRHGN
jgi:hypothetical protein